MSDPFSLDDENLLSPDTEQLPNMLPVQSVSDMESILLETSPLDETQTDENSQTQQADDSQTQPADDNSQTETAPTVTFTDPLNVQTVPEDPIVTDAAVAETSDSETKEPEIPSTVEEEDLPASEPIEAQIENLTISSPEEENKDSQGDISKYFGSPGGSDPFAGVGIGENTVVAPEAAPDVAPTLDTAPAPDEGQTPQGQTIQGEESGDSKTIRIRCNSETVPEELPVKFEESKGQGLKFTQSTKNLSKYFEESPAESDGEGREFFDTFAAAAETTTTPITIPTTSLHLDTSGSLPPPIGSLPSQTPPLSGLPPHTPPIPTGGGGDLTPHHTPSLSSHPSQEEGAIDNNFQDPADVFSASLQSSDCDRRHDAWIASEMTRQTLVAVVTSPPGTYTPQHTNLTMPGVVMEEPLGDPVRDLVVRFMGETAAQKRYTLNVDDVTQDENGLRQLVSRECYRAAVELTGRLLTAAGQGAGKLNTVTRHTPQSLQLWHARLALLIKLRLYSHAEAECQAFSTLDKPDLYYDFYPDTYPGRRGSMVSFDFRVLHAELPQYLGKTQEALDRLHYLLAIVKKILSNLESGLAEDGSILELSESSRKASRELWQKREIRLMYSIGNCLLNIKDFSTCLLVFQQLLSLDSDRKAEIHSGIGRIYLQMGDMKSARSEFEASEKLEDQTHDEAKSRTMLNRGFVALGENNFSEAHSLFKQAVQLDANNTVAVNNMAVCSLYEGKLRESLTLLEDLVHSCPGKYLQEGVLFNLCTLYELESSRAMTKKQGLLHLVNQHKGNGFNVACLKMA